MVYKRLIDNRWSYREADTKEFTHCYHTYPAMMIPQIARALITEYHPQGKLDTLLDPYMGSGTSLVEASLKGINSIGTDLNPLARLMAKVKTTHYDDKVVTTLTNDICERLADYSEEKVTNTNFDRISNHTFWYTEDSLLRLSYISQLINELVPTDLQDFFNVVLSEVVREVSFTRNGEFKRYRMSEKSLANFNPDVFVLFARKARRNIKGLEAFNQSALPSVVRICDFNSTIGIPSDIIQTESIDMVVTSPPYGDSHTTVAYGQFSRWANEWFDFPNAKDLDRHLMGGSKTKDILFTTESISEELEAIKNADEKRYFEVISFLNDYYLSICNVAKTIRKGGVVCYVVGNRNVKGVQIPLDYFTAEMFEKNGFKHNITIVREIPNKRMPSKTSPTNVAGAKVATMSNEYIVILTKNE